MSRHRRVNEGRPAAAHWRDPRPPGGHQDLLAARSAVSVGGRPEPRRNGPTTRQAWPS